MGLGEWMAREANLRTEFCMETGGKQRTIEMKTVICVGDGLRSFLHT